MINISIILLVLMSRTLSLVWEKRADVFHQ